MISLRRLFFLVLLCITFTANAQEAGNPDPEVALLQQLLRLRDNAADEKQAQLIFEQYGAAHGLIATRLAADDSTWNLALSLYPLSSRKPNILLIHHLDVVPATEPETWRHDPWSGAIYGDTVWGRGAIDCKGLAVMQLGALIELVDMASKTDLPYNITVLSILGEESSNPQGAAWITANCLDQLNAVAVYGEGGSGLTHLVPSKPDLAVFGISIAEKSSLWLKMTARKKTHGHGAVPPDLYANKRLVKALINLLDQKREVKFSKISRQMFRELGKLEGGGRGFVIKHINWLIFWPFVKKYFREGEIFHVLVENTFVITDLATQTKGSANQIGSSAYAVLDCRLLPGTDIKRFVRRVQFTAGYKVDVEIIAQSPNTPASKTGVFFTAMQTALKKVYPEALSTPILFPASTDNNFFRQKQIPTYGLIPAILSREAVESIHGQNEYLLIPQLKAGIQTYRQLISLLQQTR